VRRIARGLLPPLTAFLLARALLFAVASGTSRPPWTAGSWSGHDSAHYQSIAKSGYAIFPCSPADPPPGVCGNAGWMPLYPWIMRPLIASGLASPRWAAAFVAAGFALAALAVLWALFLSSWPRNRHLALLVAAFCPGQVFLHGAFPLGVLVTAVLVAIHFARRERWSAAGLAGAAAALCHSVGWLLAPALALWGLVRPPLFATARGRLLALRGPTLAAVLTLGGLACLFLLHGLSLGVWDAYFRVQGAYGHRLASPLAGLCSATAPLVKPPWAGAAEAPSVQALLVAVLVSALALPALRRRREPEAALVGLYVAVLWLFPLALGGTVSVYRTDAALLPGVLLARGAPRGVLALVLAAFILLAWAMGRLFFELRLV
jgi:hypothetical protein